ncbi:MAG: tyrosine-type recombinase/integrase [Mariprofundaceae bacterium]|nr:tyrosine-type recombinase/integrase [Mariprofundaceae bacterium]
MSKVTKKSLGSDSSKTVIDQAKREVPDFIEHFKKFEQQMVIGGYSSSTLFCYGRAVAKVSLYWKKSLLDLQPDQINDFLHALAEEKKASSTYFKHTVYGLRFFFRLYHMDDKRIKLPVIRNSKKLIAVFSKAELKRLLMAPKSLKYRVILALIYSAGLRISELCNLKITDIDSDRMQIQVRNSKGNKSRYVVLSDYILIGLRNYVLSSKPSVYLFNGKTKGEPLGTGSIQQSFRRAMTTANINKAASVHTLRHSYATHLLEDGLDIVSIKDLLGHSHIETTMRYLHVAKLDRIRAHSPLDTLYKES